MKARSVLFIFILFGALSAVSGRPLWGEEVRGVVIGVDQKPLEGAVVLHRASGLKAVTDAEGKFALAVPDGGKIRLEIVHDDYYDQEFMIPSDRRGERLVFALVPLVRQSSEVVVTALRFPEPVVNVPAAESVIDSRELESAMPVNITESLQEVPGVGALGSGGFSLVPSVRGLSRRRVLFLVDGVRLESDRRTGPNASFVNPDDIARIEVLRSPASVFYGSDAIGGVIQLMTKSPRMDGGFHGRLSTAYGTVNGEKGFGLGVEGGGKTTAFLLSFRSLDAENYRAPGGAKVLQSQFAQGSLVAKLVHRTESREIEAGFLGARGTDIGKPNNNALTKPTWYPRENQNIFQVRWKERMAGGKAELFVQAFADPNFLETRTDTFADFKTTESFSRTQSTDFGAQVSLSRSFADALRLSGGVDFFGRGAAKAFNTYTSFDETGAVTGVVEELPYTGGRRGDLGFFLSADYSGIKNVDLLAGARFDTLSMSALPMGAEAAVKTTNTAATGFAAVSYKITSGLTAFANLSRAYRVPSLNERFYTGISGRGFIVGQPGLIPETSLGVDGGLKAFGKRLFAGLYAFSYEISHMIERFRLDPSTYTYGNIEKGRIRGLELELEVFIRSGWKVYGNAFTIRGRSLATGTPLNDIPPVRFLAGTRVWSGRFSGEIEAVFQLHKRNPGPAEITTAGSEVVDLRADYAWGPLTFYAALINVFDAAFIARPDSEAMIEPGRNLRAGVAYAF